MQMTKDEICVRYRDAANKVKQIGILADLNACRPVDIADILREAGFELPKIFERKKKPAAEPAKKAERAPEPAPAASAPEPARHDDDTIPVATALPLIVAAAFTDAVEKILNEADIRKGEIDVRERIRGALEVYKTVVSGSVDV